MVYCLRSCSNSIQKVLLNTALENVRQDLKVYSENIKNIRFAERIPECRQEACYYYELLSKVKLMEIWMRVQCEQTSLHGNK